MEIVGPVNAVERGAVGTEDAQLSMKGLEEFGMVTLLPELLGPPFIWVRTDAACEVEGNVRKQYPGLLACLPVRGSGAGLGTLILIGSQPMRLQTCLAYSSSIQGSSSPHQSVERGDVVEVGDD